MFPSSPNLLLENGFNYLRTGHLTEAHQIAEQLLKNHPNHDGAINLAGLVALQQGEREKAIKLFIRAKKLNRKEPIYLCNLGAAYLQNHSPQDAIAACEKALKLRPDYLNALITLGSAYFALEDYNNALDTYNQALAIEPNHSQLHAYQGDALRELGKIRQAIAAYQQALTLSPDLPYAMGNYGVTLLNIGQPEKALTYCQQATEKEANNALNWINLGTVLRTLEQLEEAMEAYGKAYDLNPESAQLCTLIGQIWQEVSDFPQAKMWYEQGLGIEPERIDTLCALASTLVELGDPTNAITRYQDLIQQYPDHCQAHLGLSQALWEDGNAEEAIESARQAVALKPENTGMIAQLGNILASAGDVEGANEVNREALDINPNCISALVNLAQNLRGKLPQEDGQKMEDLLTKTWVKEGSKASLHFGLAHYYDGEKNYDLAAHHTINANKLHTIHKQARGWDYNPQEYHSYIDQMIDHFNHDFFQRTQGLGNPSQVPVFVVGMPRSGTTLTEQILASHPLVFGVGERNFASQGFYHLPAMMATNNIIPSIWDCVSGLSTTTISPLADWHLTQLQALIEKAELNPNQYQRIVDKMPDNYSLLGWLVTLFPNAKIIHCRRDVRDVAVSCWMTQFKVIRWAFDLTHIAERINEYLRIMEHWRQTLPVPMLEINYEDTVSDQVAQTQRLLEFIGLDWDDACLQFHKTERLVRTASVTQVRQPIYKRSVERWRRYESALQPLLERLTIPNF